MGESVQGTKHTIVSPFFFPSSVILAERRLSNFQNTEVKRGVANGAVTEDTIEINWRLDFSLNVIQGPIISYIWQRLPK